jgi:catechol 2,3-dioxygenase-like lactoylglutathione lyase family enzyme
MEVQTGASIRQLTTVAVPVANPDRALAFYGGVLGFETRRDAYFGEGLRWIEVAPAGATTTIALAPPGTTAMGVDTGIRLACDDAEATHRYLATHGVEIDEIMRMPSVPPMFGIRDPDHNKLYIVES